LLEFDSRQSIVSADSLRGSTTRSR